MKRSTEAVGWCAVTDSAAMASAVQCPQGHSLAGHVVVYVNEEGDIEEVCPGTFCPTCEPPSINPGEQMAVVVHFAPAEG